MFILQSISYSLYVSRYCLSTVHLHIDEPFYFLLSCVRMIFIVFKKCINVLELYYVVVIIVFIDLGCSEKGLYFYLQGSH